MGGAEHFNPGPSCFQYSCNGILSTSSPCAEWCMDASSAFDCTGIIYENLFRYSRMHVGQRQTISPSLKVADVFSTASTTCIIWYSLIS
jgi:hypothetical protein